MFEQPSASQIQDIINALTHAVPSFLPEIAVSVLFLVVLMVDVLGLKNNKTVLPIVTAIGFAITIFFVVAQHSLPHEEIFLGMYAVDPFAIFFKYLFLASGILAVLISMDSNEIAYPEGRSIGEYYALIVAMVLGMFLMASSTDMVMMLIAVELVSLTSYILAGYNKTSVASSEAALKYVIYGSVSSGFMIYGFSILYGLTGETNIFAIKAFLEQNQVDSLTLMLSILLILGGFGYKVGFVPFHFWSPDVYEGAPTPITAYLSVASKAAGFAILIRFFRVAIPFNESASIESLLTLDWVSILAVVSVASMVLGNVVAIWQNNVKRLLAYSSIAHAGYILLGVLVADDLGTQATLFYLAAYTIMNIGAFYVVILISNQIGSEDVQDYKGIGRRMPLAAASLTIFLVSLVGLPPTVGFIGKLMIFSALLNKGTVFIWLATVGILTSVISLYYYFKIPMYMYLRESDAPGAQEDLNPGILANSLVAFLMIVTIVFGLYFTPLSALAKESVYILGSFLP